MSAVRPSNILNGQGRGTESMGSYTYKLLGWNGGTEISRPPVLMKTGFLFAGPSIWSGAARLLDLGCTFNVYNYSPTDEEADAKAVYSDWLMVGNDIRNAFQHHEQRCGSSQSE